MNKRTDDAAVSAQSHVPFKDYNIELIRIVSCAMVVVIHVTNYFCRTFETIYRGEYLFALVLNTVSRVSVPCFFMISGAFLLKRKETVHRNNLRFIRFLKVLGFWSVIYLLFSVCYMETPYDIKKILYVPVEKHLWYLYMVIPIYLVLVYLQILCTGMDKKLEKRLLYIGGVFLALVYVGSYFQIDTEYNLPIIWDRPYIYFFILGHFLYKYKDTFKIRTSTLLLVFGVSNLLNLILTYSVSSWRGEHFDRILEYGSPLVMVSACAFFVLMIRIKAGNIQPGKNSKKAVDMLSSCSFGIYLIHIIFLDIFKKHVKADAVSVWAAAPLLIVSIFTISFLSIYLIRKLPGGRQIT